MATKKSIVFGSSGQDGSLLAKFLLNKNYEVHGVKRRSSTFNTKRIDTIYQEHQIKNKKLILHYGDLTDSLSLYDLLNKIKPDEFEEPPKGWIPKNEKYRLWNEIGQLSVSSTARKVVLRAKSGKVGRMPNILNDDNDI